MLQCTLLLQQQLTGSLRPAFLKQTVSDWGSVGVIFISLTDNRRRNISGLLPCCKKMKKIVLLWGPLFVGAPVRTNMLNMRKSASATVSHFWTLLPACSARLIATYVASSISGRMIDRAKTAEPTVASLETDFCWPEEPWIRWSPDSAGRKEKTMHPLPNYRGHLLLLL